MKSTSAVLCAALLTSTAWAGSHGNGAEQRNRAYGNQPPPTTTSRASYAYCYGGDPRVTYFSAVFPVPPAGYGGGVAFGRYLSERGYHNNGGECLSSLTETGAVADKAKAEDSFRATYHHHKIVETEWSGTQ